MPTEVVFINSCGPCRGELFDEAHIVYKGPVFKKRFVSGYVVFNVALLFRYFSIFMLTLIAELIFGYFVSVNSLKYNFKFT